MFTVFKIMNGSHVEREVRVKIVKVTFSFLSRVCCYLRFNNLQSLGCIEIAKLLPGNQHNQGFCELKTLMFE